MMAIDTMSLHHAQQRAVGASDDPTTMTSVAGISSAPMPTHAAASSPEPRPSASHQTVADQLQRAELASREKQARMMLIVGIIALIGGGLLAAISVLLLFVLR
jgi:hypothetical protein